MARRVISAARRRPIGKRLASIIFEEATGGFLILVCSVIIVVVIYGVIPFLPDLPPYWDDARKLARGDRLSVDHLMPVGYPLLLSLFVRMADVKGVIIAQSAVYVISVMAAWVVLRHGVGEASSRAAAISLTCLLAIAIHPYMLLNTHRINDNAFNVLPMIIMTAWCSQGFLVSNATRAMTYGIVFGLFVSIRPNALIFAALPFLGFIDDLARKKAHERLRYTLILVGFAAVTYGAVVAAATGSAFFWPSNGPYTLFCGNNPFSFDALIERFDSEPSVGPALAAIGALPGVDPHVVPPHVYLALAWKFISSHVAGFVSLCLTKLVVFFSPRILNSKGVFDTGIQILLSFPVLFWGAAVRRLWRAGHKRECVARLTFVVLYVLPFMITNATTRHRMPLDIWFILDLAVLARRYLSTVVVTKSPREDMLPSLS